MIFDLAAYIVEPEPLSTHLAYVGRATAISRLHTPEDIARCTKCPEGRCAADDRGMCLVIVPWHVPKEDAAAFKIPASEAERRSRPGRN